MGTLLEAVRSVIGEPDWYIQNGSYSGTWDYGAVAEYMVCAIILCVVVGSVFKIIVRWFDR